MQKERAPRRRRAVARLCEGFFYRLVSQLPKINFLLLCRDFLTAPAAEALTFLKRKKLAKTFIACPKVALPASPFHKFSKHGLGTPETVCR